MPGRLNRWLSSGLVLSDQISIVIGIDSDRDGVPDDVEIARRTNPTLGGNHKAQA